MISWPCSGPLRSRWLSALCLVAAVVVWTAAPSQSAAQTAPNDGPLQATTDYSRPHPIGNDTIIRMAKAGLGDDVLIQTIQLQPGHYDTAPDDLISLKQAGLSDKVISVMQAHGTGLAIRGISRTGVITPVLVHPPPLPEGIDEIGVYYKATKGEDAGKWLPLQTERVVFRSSGTLKQVLSQGVLGKDTNGYIEGPKSSLAIHTGTELLIYTPAGTDASEYFFLRLRDHKDHREFRTLTGGLFHETAGPGHDELEFTPKRIDGRIYTYTVPIDIDKGEYGILPPGSANTQGIAGNSKIFSFSIPE